MVGKLYDIRVRGKRDDFHHPHLVSIQYGENCLCIPAFTEGGHELNQTLSGLQRMGVFRHQCSVELDHSKHVVFVDGRVPHVAVYVVAKRQILSQSFVATHRHAGEMDEAGILKVTECLLEWHASRPADLPPKAVPAIRRLHEELLAKLRKSA